MTEDDELVLSNSSIGTYWRCHHRYYLENVLRLPSVGSLAMALGTAVHFAVESLFTSPLRASPFTVQTVIQSDVWQAKSVEFLAAVRRQQSERGEAISDGAPSTGATSSASPNLIGQSPTEPSMLGATSGLGGLKDISSPNTGSSWSKSSDARSLEANRSITKTGSERITVPKTSNSGPGPSDTASAPPISSALIAEDRIFSAFAALANTFIQETKSLPSEEMDADPSALSDGAIMLATYIRERLPTYHPTMVERSFTARVAGVLWTGVIDNADEKTDEVTDVKTTAGKTINGRKPSFDPERFDMQLTGYGLGYEALTGRRPKRYLLDVLKRSGKYQQYERRPRVTEFLDLVGLTRDAIMRRDYSPTGLLNGSCQFCPFTRVCEFYVEP